jgi:hypothetical protein
MALLPELVLTWNAEELREGWSKSFRVSWEGSGADSPRSISLLSLTPTFRGSVDSFAVGLRTLESAELAGLL